MSLLEKAVEYGMKGLRTSDDCKMVRGALDSLARHAPERESYCLSQKSKILRRMYSLSKSSSEKEKLADEAVDLQIQAAHRSAVKGDWKQSTIEYNDARVLATLYRRPVKDNLVTRVRVVSGLARAMEQVAKGIETLAKTPDDAKVRASVVKTLLVTLDDPIQAAKYVNDDVDQQLQAYVPLAGKDASEVPIEGCRSLAQWYQKELAKGAAPLNKYRMLRRAKTYQQRAVTLHEGSDLAVTAMKHQVVQIQADIVKLRGADPLACVYCLAAGKTECAPCKVAGKSTGKLQCAKCKSTGRMKCGDCNGAYGLKCKRCGGKGFTYVSVKVFRRSYQRRRDCDPCSGTGYMHYSTTSKRYSSGRCDNCQYHSPRGSAECSDCSGRGGKKACPACYGARTLKCTHCTSN